MTFQEEFRMHKKRAGLKLSEVAEKLGLSMSSVAKYASEHCSPPKPLKANAMLRVMRKWKSVMPRESARK
jgi:transcriptional regulator with XRE-family HTH domain